MIINEHLLSLTASRGQEWEQLGWYFCSGSHEIAGAVLSEDSSGLAGLGVHQRTHCESSPFQSVKTCSLNTTRLMLGSVLCALDGVSLTAVGSSVLCTWSQMARSHHSHLLCCYRFVTISSHGSCGLISPFISVVFAVCILELCYLMPTHLGFFCLPVGLTFHQYELFLFISPCIFLPEGLSCWMLTQVYHRRFA